MGKRSYRLTQTKIDKDNEERKANEEVVENIETEEVKTEVVEEKKETSKVITKEIVLEKVKSFSNNYTSSYIKHGQMCFNSLPYGTLSKKACIETCEMYRNGQLLQEYKDFLKKVIEEVFK